MAIKSNWGKLFKFILIKISFSFITIFLIFLSLFFSLLSTIIFFSLNLDANKFFTNFEYYIMILYGIFLFIFVLMNAIKLFGTQIEDSSFLLLLTKPYSRITIILSQYLGLFTLSLIFISLNTVILLVLGGIIGTITKVSYLIFYVKTVLKLFLFLILFSILVNTGSVTLLAFTRSQNVFLIFVICCSLFLLGGLPYSLISTETDNLQLTFKNGVGPYSVKQIKSAILFNEYYKQGLVKYPTLTKDIANFYNRLTTTQLQNVNNALVITMREKFFDDEGFNITPPNYTTSAMNGIVTNWNNHSKFDGKNVTIILSFKNYFLNIDQLQAKIDNKSSDPHLKSKRDLMQLFQDYDSKYGISNFMSLQKAKVPTLLEYELSQCTINDGSGVETFSSGDDWTKAFKDSATYVRFNDPLRSKYDAVFLNPVYILLRNVEDYIYNQVLIYRLVSENSINHDENFEKYNSVMNIYGLINYFNFIEHWNQLWTYFQGYYGDFWFRPLALSSIDFDVEKNPLFSYPDFKFNLINNNIDVTNTKSIQNNLIIVLAYSGLCVVLFGLSIFLFLRKNIS